MRVKLTRRARWAVPGTAVAVTAVVVAALQIPAAQASPSLPGKTPAQLLASLDQQGKVPPMTGTVVESTSLGLPQLPQSGGPTSLTSLLTGSHTVKVYYQDGSHFRLALPTTGAETDVIADGSKVWLWSSTSDSVTEFIPPAGAGQQQPVPTPTYTPLTPQQAASAVLKAVGKTTLVSVQSNVMVAGQAAYQLVLAPKDSRSLVGSVVIALDGANGVPLRVQVFAKGAKSPAFQVGYTAVQFVSPAPANFAFTPPPGAKVTKVQLPAAGKKSAVQGTQQVPAGTGTYGQAWLTVAAFPQSDLGNALGSGGPGGQRQNIASSKGESISVSDQELLNAFLGSGKPVHGSWGSGTLITTSLFSVLLTGGEVYLGAVQPSVLYSAVGHISS